MDDNIYYKITNSINDGDILYEEVEVDGQYGVRCRKYINIFKIINDGIDKICGENLKSKYSVYIRTKCHKKYNRIHKAVSIVWCWPTDEYDFNIGKKLSLKRVNAKIKTLVKNVESYIKHLKKYNLPKDKYKYEIHVK